MGNLHTSNRQEISVTHTAKTVAHKRDLVKTREKVHPARQRLLPKPFNQQSEKAESDE